MTAPQPHPAYAGFAGTIGKILATSEPWWPPRPSARGKPNVVVIMADDLGFADLGCYGSEIPTPNLDRLAAEGVRATNFHVTPMCSPTRASLLTGRNHHAVGFGTVANFDPGFPGFTMELPEDTPTIADAFRDAGYATFAVGKWHLCKERDMHDAGSRRSWPCQRGFDRYFGFLDGFTNLHQPHRLYRDNSALDTDTYPAGYYLTDDLTDQAITMIAANRASQPDQPFLLYLAHGAVHAPLQAPADDIAKFRGRYDAGWDVIRAGRHARQLELGVIPAGTQLAPRNFEPGHDVGAWDDLSAAQQRVYARHMEVYAAMVHALDRSVGRLRAALEAAGVWDDTIVVFTSDNGGSKEGGATGTMRYLNVLRMTASEEDIDEERLADVGGPRVLSHYPRGWAMVSNTPFRLYKINTHAGGHQVPFIVNWPAGRLTGGELRTQYAYITDLYPTLADLAGVAVAGERGGRTAPEIDGMSFAGMLRSADAPATRREQYYEMTGHRGYYRDGWEIVSFHARPSGFSDGDWQLYDLGTDPTELHDLASEHPERVAEFAAAWEAAAWRNGVYPLDEGVGLRGVFRPSRPEWSDPIDLPPGVSLERARSEALIGQRPFAIVVSMEHGAGDRGVLVAHGGQGGGYLLYIDEDRLWWAHNDFGDLSVHDLGPVEAGSAGLSVQIECPQVGIWDVVASTGGEARALHAPSGMSPYEGIDIGRDRRSPVHWELAEAEGSFPYSGALHAVRYEPGALLVDPEKRIAELRELGRRFE